jgi:hypothetical protein
MSIRGHSRNGRRCNETELYMLSRRELTDSYKTVLVRTQGKILGVDGKILSRFSDYRQGLDW